MNLLKKALSVLIACTMMFSFVPMAKWGTASAYDLKTIVEDGITYYLIETEDDAVVALSSVGKEAAKDIVIPEEINGYPVMVTPGAFTSSEGITSVTIPASTEDFSFLIYTNSENLKKIIVDENNPYCSNDEYGVLYSKDKTELLLFPAGCEVENYTIPASVTAIGNAFDRGMSIKSFSVEEGNTAYSCDEYGVLYSKDGKTLVKFPSGSTLKEYTVPDGVETIGNAAFAHLNNLESLTLPASVTNADGAFAHITGLKRFEMSNSNILRGYNFSDCGYAEKITVNENKVIVEWGEENSPATAISIGKTVSDLNRIKDLQLIIDGFGEITVEEGNEAFTVVDGVLYDKNIETLLLFPSGTDKKTFVMPDSVITVDDRYFVPFKNLTSLTFGKNFDYTGINLEEEKEEFGSWYAYNSYSLMATAFNSSNIKEFNVSEENPHITSVDGVLYSKDKKALIAYPQAKELDEIVIDDDTVICRSAYMGEYEKVTFGEKFSENVYNRVCEYLTKIGKELTEINIKNEFANYIARILMHFSAKEFAVSENDKYLSVVDGVLYAFDESILMKYPIGNDETFYSVPESVLGFACPKINDISATPFFSFKAEKGDKVSMLMKDNFRVHLADFDLYNNLGFSLGVSELCTEENTEKVQEVNTNNLINSIDDAYYRFTSAAVEKEYQMCMIDQYLHNVYLNTYSPIYDNICNSVTVCGGNHTFDLASENENVFAEYDIGCFGELDNKVSLKVEETKGEKAEEMASIIVQSFSGVFPKQIYNISTVDNDGKLVQPSNGKVRIKIKLPEDCTPDDKFLVFHWLSDTDDLKTYSGEKLKVESVNGEDFLVFEVDHFSYFAVCVEEEIPAEKTVSSISIASLPSKTAYLYKYENLDITGLELTVTYSDGSTETVADTSKMTVSGFDGKKVGNQTVTVEYEGATAKFDVTVSYAWWQWIIRILFLGFLWY